ncbi:hypothetical protein Hdeb2414_s0008g00288131 [Helianthus debilis subsp. tardiflorus]
MPEQEKELADLRGKCLSKILLSDVNKVHNVIDSEVREFVTKSIAEKEELAKRAFAMISARFGCKAVVWWCIRCLS